MADLIKRWQKGDMNAFEALFEQYKGLVFKNAILMTGNIEEAEDILQEVFFTVWNSLNNFDPGKGNFTTWLHRITINRCIDSQRKRKQASLPLEEQNLDLPEIGCQELPEETLMRKLEYERLINAVNQLDNKHRSVLILRYFNDLSYNEIAEVLEIPVGTVKSRIYNALRSVRGQINLELTDINMERRKS